MTLRTTLRLPNYLVVAALAILAVCPLAGIFLLKGSLALVMLFVLGTFVHWPFDARQMNWNARPREADIRAAADGLHADGSLLIPRERIAEGHLESGSRSGERQRPEDTSVRVRLRNAKGYSLVDIDMPDRARGEAFLAALGLSDPSVAATFVIESTRLVRMVRSVLAIAILCAGGLVGMLWVDRTALMVGLLFGMYLNNLPWQTRRARIAADGVTVSWFGRHDFTPFSRVRSVRRLGPRTVLTLNDESEIGLEPVSGGRAASALETRVEVAFTTWTSTGVTVDASDLVARKGRTVAEWAGALRELSREIVDYRKSAVPKEALWRLLEDPHADTTARAGAAFALAEQDGNGPRLQRVSGSVASPRLRIALERIVAAGEEVARREALALVESEEESPEEARPPSLRQH